MPKRPYVSFAEVKEKVPIPDALAVLGLAGRFDRKGDTLTGVCPLPSHQHGPSPNDQQFKINFSDGVWLWHCFGDCQRGGDVVELVKAMTGFDNAHVRFWFADKFGDRLTLSKSAKRDNGPVEKDTTCESQAGTSQAAPITPSNLPAPLPPLKPLRFHLILNPDVPYLHQRGLTADTIRRYGVGLCNRGVLKGYVAIPIHRWPDEDGENPVAYLGRWPSDDEQELANRCRYKWPEGFCKTRVVYGLREALTTSIYTPLIVVEGPLSVLYLAQAGFPNTVAVFGSALSDEQAEILASTGRRIVLFFDGDEAGQAGMRAAAGKLITRAFVRVAKLGNDAQPDQLSRAQLQELLP